MTTIDLKNQVTWSHQVLSALYDGPFENNERLSTRGALMPITGVAVNSRLVKPGDLFIALAGDPGERFKTSARSNANGHDYLAHALENGAVGALVSHLQDVGIPQYQTADTYDGLWQLGKAGRERLAGPILAVTGSSGKTTAKSFLAEALQAYAPPGSFNNHIGVPLSLANAWQQAPAWCNRTYRYCSTCKTLTLRTLPPDKPWLRKKAKSFPLCPVRVCVLCTTNWP